jgi:predicted transposase YdaD
MKYAEKLLHEGRQEGLQEGRQAGRIDTLVKLLTLKFGELPPEYGARLEQASLAQLDRYTERVLFADSLAAVFAD